MSPLSLLMLKGRRRNNHRNLVSKGQFSQRKATETDVDISLTEHVTEHVTEHTLDSICSNYLEPQDEEPIVQLSTLFDLINNREWDLLSKELTPETLRVDSGSLLHLALHFHAPSSIIYQITNGIQPSVSYRDAKGRLPLHVAVSKGGARPSIISHLVKLSPKACTSKDNQGKTPLHRCFDDKVLHALKPSQLRDLVGTLVQTSEDALIMEDQNRRCPIELAIRSQAPMNTISFMQVMKLQCLRARNTSLPTQSIKVEPVTQWIHVVSWVRMEIFYLLHSIRELFVESALTRQHELWWWRGYSRRLASLVNLHTRWRVAKMRLHWCHSHTPSLLEGH